jgi:3'-phosphoadenosine 5'-phosphosulfate sulfotransferase (PAPS reductase)/FAD synthetase
MSDTKHIVALSGGKDSTAMAIMLARMEPRDYIYICTPTGDESDEMIAHWANLEDILGAPLVMVRNHSLKFFINEFKALPNWRQRWCTRLLKIEPTLAFLKANMPCVQYVGLRADEEEREGIYSSEIPQRFPLREWGWTIEDVRQLLRLEHITIPVRTDCLRCYGQRLGEWFLLWRDHPDIYAEAEAEEAMVGATYRSPGRDTWPAALKDLRAEFERGRKIRGFSGQRTEVCRACSL